MMQEMSSASTPIRLDLKKDKQLEIDWQDGRKCVYPLALLRSLCPCAQCRQQRDEQARNRRKLTILPGNYTGPIRVVDARMVGNYAIQIEWSDQHASGIYSFEYLRDICPPSQE
jgi:DUF971 family protein